MNRRGHIAMTTWHIGQSTPELLEYNMDGSARFVPVTRFRKLLKEVGVGIYIIWHPVT